MAPCQWLLVKVMMLFNWHWGIAAIRHLGPGKTVVQPTWQMGGCSLRLYRLVRRERNDRCFK